MSDLVEIVHRGADLDHGITRTQARNHASVAVLEMNGLQPKDSGKSSHQVIKGHEMVHLGSMQEIELQRCNDLEMESNDNESMYKDELKINDRTVETGEKTDQRKQSMTCRRCKQSRSR